MKSARSPKQFFLGALLSGVLIPGSLDASIINVVETGGDNEATDTITAKWSGVTYDTTIDNEPVPGAAGTPYTVGSFMSGSPAFVDRNHAYVNDPAGIAIPTYLVGQEYIMSGNDNRDNAGYILDVVIDVPSRAYMLIDNRLPDGVNTTPPALGAGAMQWIIDDGWVPSSTGNNRSVDISLPDELPIDEGADGSINQYYSVYYKDFDAGTFQLFQADNAGRNMYGVVVVPNGDAPPIVLSATPSLISEGGSANLDWLIPEDATVASIDQGIGDILPGTVDGVGSMMVSPGVTTTYMLSVESPGGDAMTEATVVVRLVDSFAADTSLISTGDSVLLSWSTRSDATVTISGIGEVPTGDSSLVVNPTETTTYTLTAESGDESVQATVEVFVIPGGDLYALLDIGATDGTPEAGALTGAQLGAAAAGVNGTDLIATALTSETGDDFSIAIDNIDPLGVAVGGLDWRDRGDSTGELWTFLGEDHVKNNAGMIRVTLSGLDAGSYDVLSWHFDPTFAQSESIMISVTDANGTAVDTGVVGSAFAAPTVSSINNTTTNMVGHTVQFGIESNGVDDVIIYFDGRAAADTETPINGLRLSLAGPQVPLEIVGIVLDEALQTVSIEFTSKPGRTYSIYASTDLVDFLEELDDSFEGAEGTSTYVDPNVDTSVVPRKYYRIREN